MDTTTGTGNPYRRMAQLTGVLLLIMATAAIAGATATAESLRDSPGLFRLGAVASLVTFMLDVPVAVLFYLLLRHVSPAVAMVSAAFRLVYAAMIGALLALLYAALPAITTGSSIGGQDGQGVVTAAGAFGMYADGFTLALGFFGVHLLLLGWLLWESRQLPRVFGALIVLGGAGYLGHALLLLLAPDLADSIGTMLAVLGFSELLLALWLAGKGLRPSSPDGLREAGQVSHGAS